MAVEVTRNLDRFVEKVNKEVLRVKQVVGEKFVINARESVSQSVYGRQVYEVRRDKDGNVTSKTPRDRRAWELTGNLLSSIGYTIVHQGKVLQKYETSKMGGSKGKQEGESHGRSLALEVGDSGIIANAGMSYAAAVESKGYDVITESTKTLQKDYDRMIERALKAMAQ